MSHGPLKASKTCEVRSPFLQPFTHRRQLDPSPPCPSQTRPIKRTPQSERREGHAKGKLPSPVLGTVEKKKKKSERRAFKMDPAGLRGFFFLSLLIVEMKISITLQRFFFVLFYTSPCVPRSRRSECTMPLNALSQIIDCWRLLRSLFAGETSSLSSSANPRGI